MSAKKKRAKRELTRQDIAKVAAFADVTPATVRRAFLGATRSATTRAAIVRALRDLGWRAEALELERKAAE